LFELIKKDGAARRGRLRLKHGVVETPIFMPVGTVGSVKTLTPRDLNECEAQIILGNTYHLFLRPGLEVIRNFGGLHKFINWDKPILTDSGGYQIFSLGKLNKLTEDGAHFQSHLDGRKFILTPELAVEIQETLGSDIHMVLDECTSYPATPEQAKISMERSMRWAKRCRVARKDTQLMQFSIVQGGMHEELRKQSASELVAMEFDGYAIGGLSVGESKEEMAAMTEVSCGILPEHKPRYLMGVGTPLDLLDGVSRGVDMFDCVMPTRNGRNGGVFTSVGKYNIRNEKNKMSDESIDPECGCYACRTYSRGYVRHLYQAGEILALQALSLHNIFFYLDLMKKARAAIEEGSFKELHEKVKGIYL